MKVYKDEFCRVWNTKEMRVSQRRPHPSDRITETEQAKRAV